MIDAHVHLYDTAEIDYAIFARRDPTFESLVGDYAALPPQYTVAEYRRATAARPVDGIVWHEFLADDPAREIRWAQQLADHSDLAMALVAVADFADPQLDQRLELLSSLPNVTAVRQHLAWDHTNPLRRMAPRPDYLTDSVWQKGLKRLQGSDLHCGLEVFSPQLGELTTVVERHPDIGFTIAVLGWPISLDEHSRSRWRNDLAALSRCDNTVASISAVECIFGLDWDADMAADWISTVVDLFGVDRCMFGSHLPIDNLSYGFDRLYRLYDRVLDGCSATERDAAYGATAQHWFRVPTPGSDGY